LNPRNRLLTAPPRASCPKVVANVFVNVKEHVRAAVE